MKKMQIVTLSLLILLISLLLFPSAFAASDLSAETFSEVIRKAAPVEFGYLDHTEYYMQHFFSDLSYVDDSCIVVCADSTNFNEFGVFHISNKEDVKRCEKSLKRYVSTAREHFKNGVIYDIKEYPKFENARVIVAGDYVIYMILDNEQGAAALSAIKQYLK